MAGIYTLSDPRSGVVRYVGRALNPSRRLRAHLSAARHGSKDHRASWIRSLFAVGAQPVLAVIEESEEPIEAERRWILHFLTLGNDLTNSDAVRGDGFLRVSDEVRAKMRAAKLGKVPWNKGTHTPPEVRAKQRLAKLGKPSWNRGVKRPPQTECLRGHQFLPETTFIRRNGKRACRICIRLKDNERYHRCRSPRRAGQEKNY